MTSSNDKKRFELSADGLRIRASQEHSVEVDLQYEPRTPPDILHHGTASRFVDSIRAQGLLKMERHQVHLAAETKMTLQAGARHGRPVLLTIRAKEMREAGHLFCCTANGMWLVEAVPPEFIVYPE